MTNSVHILEMLKLDPTAIFDLSLQNLVVGRIDGNTYFALENGLQLLCSAFSKSRIASLDLLKQMDERGERAQMRQLHSSLKYLSDDQMDILLSDTLDQELAAYKNTVQELVNQSEDDCFVVDRYAIAAAYKAQLGGGNA